VPKVVADDGEQVGSKWELLRGTGFSGFRELLKFAGEHSTNDK